MKELQLPDGRKLLLPVLPMDVKSYALEKYSNGQPALVHTDIGNEVWFEILPEGKYTILGTIHYENGAYVLGFDPTPFVTGFVKGGAHQSEYTLEKQAEEIFVSRLNAEADVWFVNPLGEEQVFVKKTGNPSWIDDFKQYKIHQEAWRAAEEKVVRGKLLVIQQG